MQQKIFSQLELFTYHFPSVWFLLGALSCKSACYDHFWTQEAMMDLANSIRLDFYVMQKKACDFYQF